MECWVYLGEDGFVGGIVGYHGLTGKGKALFIKQNFYFANYRIELA